MPIIPPMPNRNQSRPCCSGSTEAPTALTDEEVADAGAGETGTGAATEGAVTAGAAGA